MGNSLLRHNLATILTPPKHREIIRPDAEPIVRVEPARREWAAGPNGEDVPLGRTGKTYEPFRVNFPQITIPANLNSNLSLIEIYSQGIVDTIILSVPKNELYYGFSFSSAVQFYIGATGNYQMLAEYIMGPESGLNARIPVNPKRYTVSCAIWSPTANATSFNEYCFVTFQNLGDGR